MIRNIKLVWTVLSIGVLAMATRRAEPRMRAHLDAAEATTPGDVATTGATAGLIETIEPPAIPADVADDATQLITMPSRFAGHQPPAENPFPYRSPEVKYYSFRASVAAMDEFNAPVGEENQIHLTGSKAFVARASRTILDAFEQEAAA